MATELPFRDYSTADGLPSNAINRIVIDSRGFLWFSTSNGAARFDGYQFLNFGLRDGLSSRRVNDILETRDGAFWIATSAGLCRLRKSATEAPAVDREYFPPGSRWITRLLEARSLPSADPQIWCGTDGGFYRFHPRDGVFEEILLSTHRLFIFDLYEDESGTLWLGTNEGLFRYERGSVVYRYAAGQGLPANQVNAVQRDSNGKLWVATAAGAARLSHDIVDRVLKTANGLAGDYLYSILPLRDGGVWLAGTGGITVVDGNGSVRNRLRAKDGLVVDDVEALARDPAGNIWAGTDGAGTVKLPQTGFTTFSENDGILGRPAALIESRNGEVGLITKTSAVLRIYIFKNGQFRLLRSVPSTKGLRWGDGQIGFQSASGEWWLVAGDGLLQFSASGQPGAPGMAMTGSRPLKIFEDSRGDVWMAFRQPGPSALARWRCSGARPERIEPDAGSPAPSSFPAVFAEDRNGAVWIGYFQGPLMRYRNGRLKEVPLPGRASRGIRSLLADTDGRLWVGTSEAGVLLIRNPESEQPVPQASGWPDDLGDPIECLAEDAFSRLYACTSRGVAVLNPKSHQLRRYTSEDGLVKGEVQFALRDRQGTIWFASSLGVSRFMPREDRHATGPYVHINRLEIAGLPQGISRLGQGRVGGLRLPFGVAPIRIEVTGVTFRPGEVLRYQTMMEGAETEWSSPSLNRVSTYVALSPGSYRFRARAVDSEGAVSASAAEVAFDILPPLWRRWWFVALAASTLAAAVLAAHRLRVARLMQIVRVRNRISSDLHDDIGATLSQIVILSEVARHASGAEAGSSLERVSELASQVLEAMSDIIWAINPARDRSPELIQRMRHFATDLLTAAEIEFTFRVDNAIGDSHTDPNLRRQLLLIFKEAVNNVVRHSNARHVTLIIWTRADSFGFEVSDDGRGFDRTSLSGDGHGLPGMEKRARDMRGHCHISSAPGEGTAVRVEVPIGRRYMNR